MPQVNKIVMMKLRRPLNSIDYSEYTDEELEDVWLQIDDYQYKDRAVAIYLAMYKRKIARFDDQPEDLSFENDLLWLSSYKYEQEEEYQYQQRELSAKEQRVVNLIETRCQ